MTEPSKIFWNWKLDIPPKIKHFLGKICVNGLATKVRLNQSHIGVPLRCELCDSHVEDAIHLFFECPLLKDILIKANLCSGTEWEKIIRDTQNMGFGEAMVFLAKHLKMDRFVLLCFLWWHIWFARNRLLFANELFTQESETNWPSTLDQTKSSRPG